MAVLNETRSQFRFDEKTTLVLVAPDDPEAPISRFEGDRLWRFEIMDANGKPQGERSPRGPSSDLMWYPMSKLLYRIFSSREVNRRAPKIQSWINQEVQAYHERNKN